MLIPLLILNMKDEKPLPVYGEGKNVRDWIHVYDHNRAVWEIMNNGRAGETYNIGGENEWKNIDIVHLLCEKMAMQTGKEAGYYKKLITFVKDRPGHDVRYAINCEKIKKELGWKQDVEFGKGVEETIRWYIENEGWVDRVRSGGYRSWIARNYGGR
jgi:dTDP-glucose 4,6-dehydratase